MEGTKQEGNEDSPGGKVGVVFDVMKAPVTTCQGGAELGRNI